MTASATTLALQNVVFTLHNDFNQSSIGPQGCLLMSFVSRWAQCCNSLPESKSCLWAGGSKNWKRGRGRNWGHQTSKQHPPKWKRNLWPHAGNQKCRGCKIPVDIVIPLAGLQPLMEKFLEGNKSKGLMLGNQAFIDILTFWGEILKCLEAHADICSKCSVGIEFNFFPLQNLVSCYW